MKKTLLAMALVLLCSVPSFAGSGELYLYIWSEYIPDEVVENFTKETGITVNISTYDSNEAMYAKIKLAGEGYDLIVPSSDYVGLMRRQDMLLPLDKTKLTNFANLAPDFVDQPFDPDNTFSVPYMWGSTAIAVNTAIIDADAVSSINDLWKPELNGRLLLPNEPREAFTLALKSLGYSLNETDPAHLEEAYRKLQKLMPSVRVFDSDSPKQALLSGEVTVGVVWNGEAYIANQENSEIVYVYPAEGFSLWMDSLCIPKGAKNLDEAHAFLNYLLRPEVAATISTEMGYSTPNAKAMEIIPEDVRSNPIVYPAEDVAARGEFQDDIGEAMKIYEDYWIKLKGASN
ncbi:MULTISPECIES: extracellular solute-binding protein [unclassified Pseudodesulfovibrio]|uniref:extracellular solute-binding protein n=1 Tax=unclassified Pseudodesulfovibrio TaxID=2661612 RepID=UPI000FEB6AD1|nr:MULTISPECIES: extracellular solute-binding protein [unclassified Pseudodesulfovibrio]MCJ2164554.1 extracellular solute-binding protein [Pseudodesulfovibrio sp. S3-i]RWU04752.1 extracellular solute-binding protein [Pseudodesulfovibrio sp. S3]